VHQPYAERTSASGAPVFGKEPDWRSALTWQACLIGASCHSPAATRIDAPIQAVVVAIIAESSPAPSSPPLQGDRRRAETRPGCEIAGGGGAGRHPGSLGRPLAAADTREDQKYGALGSIIVTIITDLSLLKSPSGQGNGLPNKRQLMILAYSKRALSAAAINAMQGFGTP
jgi:hypothetical protein